MSQRDLWRSLFPGEGSLAAVPDNVKKDLNDLLGPTGCMPSQVNDLPPTTGRAEVSVLVERLVSRSEMELPAVALDSESDRRKGKVEPCDNPTVVVAERLQTQPLLVGPDDGLRQCVGAHHRTKIHQRARLAGAGYAIDRDEVRRSQLFDPVRDDCQSTRDPYGSWVSNADLAGRMREPVEAEEGSGAPVRGNRVGAEERGHTEPPSERVGKSRYPEHLASERDEMPLAERSGDASMVDSVGGGLTSCEYAVLRGRELSNGAPGVVEHGANVATGGSQPNPTGTLSRRRQKPAVYDLSLIHI